MTNPYAPPQSMVLDVSEPADALVRAERITRLGAALLDSLLILAVIYGPILLAAFVAGLIGDDQSAAAGAAVIVGGLAALSGLGVWITFTVRFVRENGQSIGKRMLNIKVVRLDGSAASLGRIFWLRNALNGLLSLIPLYGVIDVLFIFGEGQQCLHDRIADTIVVKA